MKAIRGVRGYIGRLRASSSRRSRLLLALIGVLAVSVVSFTAGALLAGPIFAENGPPMVVPSTTPSDPGTDENVSPEIRIIPARDRRGSGGPLRTASLTPPVPLPRRTQRACDSDPTG